MIEDPVVVIGGGVTGAGVARDLAMRGVDAVLVERGDLAAGTTGRMHGLLHSGARYAVSDPESARDCIAENRILRLVAPGAVHETGGLFVSLPADAADYFEANLDACRDCDIAAEPLDGDEARATEPALAADAVRAIRVPDATVDPFRLTVATAADAEERGVRIETHAEVTDLEVEGGRVVGVEVEHSPTPGTDGDEAGSTETIRASHVVNAAGPWAGRVAGLAGVSVELRPVRGAMVVADYGGLGAVVNRCRPRSDGDIVVPHDGAAILGTTSVPVDDPDDVSGEQWEVELLREECSALVPDLRRAPIVSAYSGVRPLFEPTDEGRSSAATRDFAVLDHGNRDGVPGLTSVVGGKLTTHRLMAERATDRVCEGLGVDAACRTADVPLLDGADADEIDHYVARYGLDASLVGTRD